MGAVDQLAARAGKDHLCAYCPHSSAWHEKTQHGEHVKIGGRCLYPGCTGCRGYATSPRR